MPSSTISACPSCRAALRLPADIAPGSKVKCPRCGTVFVPDVAPLSPAPAAHDTAAGPGDSQAAGSSARTREGTGQDGGDAAATGLRPPQQPDELGRLGSFRVLKILGRGGMGMVYLAEDTKLHRPVALKVMLPTLAAHPRFRHRFLREAQAQAAVEHDHVAAIHQVDEDDGVPFIAMPLLKGETLNDTLRREGRLDVAELLRIGREAAEGLAAAHQRGLIHRDVKPSNLWLEGPRRRVKLLDFGLARAVEGTDAAENTHLTPTEVVVGTPSYMAPEQAAGAPVDARSDLFSLGVVLYQLATGTLPFQGSSTLAILTALATTTPRPPRELNPALPEAINALIMRLLAKDAHERLPNARAVADALAALETPHEAPRINDPTPNDFTDQTLVLTDAPTPPNGRRRWLVPASVIGLLVLVGGGVMVTHYIRRGTNGDAVAPDGTQKPKLDALTRAEPIEPRPVPRVSPLDHLDPAQIPAAERFDWQPKELVAVIGQHRRRHLGPGLGVTVSPDGLWVVTAGSDGLRVWDAATMRLHHWLSTRMDGNGRLAFMPDGKTLVTADSHEVRSWAFQAGKLDGPRFRRGCTYQAPLAVAPDGKWIATASQSSPGDVCLIDGTLDDAQKTTVLRGQDGAIVSLAFDPDGKRLVAGGENGTIRVWDVAAPEPRVIQHLDLHKDAVNALAFSPDGRLLATGSRDARLVLWDVTAGQYRKKQELKSPAVLSLAFSHDSKTLAAGVAHSRPDESQVCVWNLSRTTAPVETLSCRYGDPKGVAFTRAGNVLLATGTGAVVRVWDHVLDAPAGKRWQERAFDENLPNTFTTQGFALVDGGAALLTAHTDGAVRRWDLTGTKPALRWRTQIRDGALQYLAAAADGRRFVAGLTTGGGRLYREAEGKASLEQILPLTGMGPVAPVFTPDGNWLAACVLPERLTIWDLRGPKAQSASIEPIRWDFSYEHEKLTLSTSRALLAVGQRAKVGYWDLTGPVPVEQVLWRTKAGEGSPTDVRLSADDRTLYAVFHPSTEEARLRFWDVSQARSPRERPGFVWKGYSDSRATLAPDQRHLYLWGRGTTQTRIAEYDVTQGKPLRTWDLPPGVTIAQLEVSADARHLLALLGNGVVYVLRLTP